VVVKKGAFWPTRVVAHAVGTGSRVAWTDVMAHAHSGSRRRPKAPAAAGRSPSPNSWAPRIRISSACPRLFAPTASSGPRTDDKAQARANPWGGTGSVNKLAGRHTSAPFHKLWSSARGRARADVQAANRHRFGGGAALAHAVGPGPEARGRHPCAAIG